MKGSIVEVSQQVAKFRGQALEQVTDMEEEAKKLAMVSICYECIIHNFVFIDSSLFRLQKFAALNC